MKDQTLRKPKKGLSGQPRPGFIICLLSSFHRFIIPGTCLLTRLALGTSTNTSTDAIPALRPPHGEIGPGFLEERRSAIVIGSLVVAVCVIAAIWWIRWTRPQAVIPPEVWARDALKALSGQSEDGLL